MRAQREECIRARCAIVLSRILFLHVDHIKPCSSLAGLSVRSAVRCVKFILSTTNWVGGRTRTGIFFLSLLFVVVSPEHDEVAYHGREKSMGDWATRRWNQHRSSRRAPTPLNRTRTSPKSALVNSWMYLPLIPGRRTHTAQGCGGRRTSGRRHYMHSSRRAAGCRAKTWSQWPSTIRLMGSLDGATRRESR
jgi:hypothetical protein